MQEGEKKPQRRLLVKNIGGSKLIRDEEEIARVKQDVYQKIRYLVSNLEL